MPFPELGGINMNSSANTTAPSMLPVRTPFTGVPRPPIAGSSGGITSTPLLAEQAQTALATQRLLEQSHAALLARRVRTHELLFGATLRNIMMDVAEHIGREAGSRIMNAEKQCAETKEQAMQIMQRMQETCEEQVKQAQNQEAIERARGDELAKELAVASQAIKSLEMKLKYQELQFKQRWEELMDTQRAAKRESVEGRQVTEEKTESVSIVYSKMAQDKYERVINIEREMENEYAYQARGPEKGARLERTKGENMNPYTLSFTTTKVSHRGGRPFREVLHDENTNQGVERKLMTQLTSFTGLLVEEKDCQILTPPGKADVEFVGQIQCPNSKEFEICDCGACPGCIVLNNRGFSLVGKRKSTENEERDVHEVIGKVRKLLEREKEQEDQVTDAKVIGGFPSDVLSKERVDVSMCSSEKRQQSTKELQEKMEISRLEGVFLSKKQGTTAIIVNSDIGNANMAKKHKITDKIAMESEHCVNVQGQQSNNSGLEDTLDNEKAPQKECLQHETCMQTDTEGLKNKQKDEEKQRTVHKDEGKIKLGGPSVESDEDMNEILSQEGRRERENLGESSFNITERKASNVERTVRVKERTKALTEIMSQGDKVMEERKKCFDKVGSGGKRGAWLSVNRTKGSRTGRSANSVTVMRKKIRTGVMHAASLVTRRANIVSRRENESSSRSKRAKQSMDLSKTWKSGSAEESKENQKVESERFVVSEEAVGFVLASMADEMSVEEARSRKINFGARKEIREK